MAADKNAFMEKLLKERQADFDKKQEDYTKLMDEARATRLEVRYFVKIILFVNLQKKLFIQNGASQNSSKHGQI